MPFSIFPRAQSLAKPRSLSNSYRKNVRFASVVSEIPVQSALSSVAEVESEQGEGEADRDQQWGLGDLTSASASATDSPVRYMATRPRTRSLELAIVTGELPSTATPVFTVPIGTPPTANNIPRIDLSATFSTPAAAAGSVSRTSEM